MSECCVVLPSFPSSSSFCACSSFAFFPFCFFFRLNLSHTRTTHNQSLCCLFASFSAKALDLCLDHFSAFFRLPPPSLCGLQHAHNTTQSQEHQQIAQLTHARTHTHTPSRDWIPQKKQRRNKKKKKARRGEKGQTARQRQQPTSAATSQPHQHSLTNTTQQQAFRESQGFGHPYRQHSTKWVLLCQQPSQQHNQTQAQTTLGSS